MQVLRLYWPGILQGKLQILMAAITSLVCLTVTDNNIFNNNTSQITLFKNLASFHSLFDFEDFFSTLVAFNCVFLPKARHV